MLGNLDNKILMRGFSILNVSNSTNISAQQLIISLLYNYSILNKIYANFGSQYLSMSACMDGLWVDLRI